MPAAQHVLEEAEEDLDRPAVAVDQGDDPGRQIEQVGGDQQQAVAGRAAAFLVRRGLHDDQAQRMIGPVFGVFVFAEAHDGIEHDARFDVFRRQAAAAPRSRSDCCRAGGRRNCFRRRRSR